MDCQHVEGFEAISTCGVEEISGLVGGEGGDVLLRDLRRVNRFGHVTRHKVPAQRMLQRSVQDDVKVLDRARREPFVQLCAVEALKVSRRQPMRASRCLEPESRAS